MLVIREATAADALLLCTMIRELADFEREFDKVDISPEDIVRDGFGANPCFRAFIAEWDRQPAGYAFYFFTYSTWAGRPSLFVEDLFVRAEFRGKGIGTALLRQMATIAHKQNCYAMRWEVLDWNKAAIDFYCSLGAKVQDQWRPVIFMRPAFEKIEE